MTKLWKNVLVLWAISMGIAMSAPALAANAVGPYYATPSWDQTLPAATRFIVLTNLGSAAVLDRETGLVWEQSPDTTSLLWIPASNACANKFVGNRGGWRLPSVQELASLIDRTVATPTKLPLGHPFNVDGDINFWTATAWAGSPEAVMRVVSMNAGVFIAAKAIAQGVWCVRGGQGADVQ